MGCCDKGRRPVSSTHLCTHLCWVLVHLLLPWQQYSTIQPRLLQIHNRKIPHEEWYSNTASMMILPSCKVPTNNFLFIKFLYHVQWRHDEQEISEPIRALLVICRSVTWRWNSGPKVNCLKWCCVMCYRGTNGQILGKYRSGISRVSVVRSSIGWVLNLTECQPIYQPSKVRSYRQTTGRQLVVGVYNQHDPWGLGNANLPN